MTTQQKTFATGSNNINLTGFHGSVFDAQVVENSSPADAAGKVKSSPDIDLVGMARWALQALKKNPRPNLDYECRFSIKLLQYPPCPGPNDHDPITIGDTDNRLDWEFGYMKDMTGDASADEVAQGVRKRVLGYLRDDGNCWVTVRMSCTMPGIWAVPWTTGKLLVSLSDDFRRTGNEKNRPLCRKMFTALRSRADWVEGRAYYAAGNSFFNEKGWAISECTPYHPAFVLEPVVRYYEVFHDQEALDFAIAFAEGEMANDQWHHWILRNPANLTPEQKKQRAEFTGIPEFPETPMDLDFGVRADGSFVHHSHMRGHQGWGMAHLASLTREPRLVAWSKRLLDFFLSRGTDYGWIPEGMSGSARSETCAVADVINIAEGVAKCGYPEYWDVVERFVRNYIREAQFFFSPEYESLYRSLHPGEKGENGLAMARELQGGFQGAMGIVDRTIHMKDIMDMMGCCVPEGMRSIYTAWKNTIIAEPDGVHVNMGFSRDSAEAKVSSFLPYKGGMEVVAKVARDFWLRPPAWAPRARVQISRRGKNVPAVWRGAYLFVGKVEKGETLTMTYPLASFGQKQTVTRFPDKADRNLAITWLGNTVVKLEPRGEKLPLYQDVPRPLPPIPA